VGQKSALRKTSLISDRAVSAGSPMGLFAWQLMMHAWLNRPYGTEKAQDGPIIRFGYYDLRTLGQSLYNPCSGKTILEYDNSPTLGGQAMAMVKYHLSGLRPVRDPKKPLALQGAPTLNERLCAYPFRDEKKAVIALNLKDAGADGAMLTSQWKLSGIDFSKYKPVNIYGQPLKVENGVATAQELPIFILGLSADQLPAAVSAMAALRAESVKAAEQQQVQMGPYVLDIDPSRKGLMQLSVVQDGKKTVIIDRLVAEPVLPKPTIEVTEGRVNTQIAVTFVRKDMGLGITMSDQGVTFQWRERNNLKKILQRTVRFRVSPSGAGRNIVIQQGPKITSGRLREDYGELHRTDAKPTPIAMDANAGRVWIENFASFDMSPASGRNIEPCPGFGWKVADGEAFLQSVYALPAHTGVGASGSSVIQEIITVTLPEKKQ